MYLKERGGRGVFPAVLEETVRFELRQTESDIEGRRFSRNSRDYVFRAVSPIDVFGEQAHRAALQNRIAGFRDDTERVRAARCEPPYSVSTGDGASEDVFHSELNLARRPIAVSVRGEDSAERGGIEDAVRKIEIRVVREVEELHAKLEPAVLTGVRTPVQ